MGVIDEPLTVLKSYDLAAEQWDLVDQIAPGTKALWDRTLERYSILNAEPADEIPLNSQGTWTNALRGLESTLPGPSDLHMGNPNTHAMVTTFRNVLDQTWNTWRNEGRPYVRANDIDTAGFSAELSEALAAARAAQGEAEHIRDTLQRTAAVAGTLELAQHYDSQAAGHRRTTRVALAVLIGLTATLLVGGWLIIHSIPPTDEWTTLVRDALARGFAIAALSYGIAFTARVYRTNSHLRAVYEQKASALKTFSLFSAAVDDSDARTLILGELVRSVFASATTGVFEKDTEHTVVETAVPLAAAFAKSAGR